jgi:hypothetical protein
MQCEVTRFVDLKSLIFYLKYDLNIQGKNIWRIHSKSIS